jgi:hypothetical protein
MDKIVLYSLDEARAKLDRDGGFEPFTVIANGEALYVESHAYKDAAACLNSARTALQNVSSLADGYSFCYDGYVRLKDGVHDAIVAERAAKGDELAETFAILYNTSPEEDGGVSYDQNVYALGKATSLFVATEAAARVREGLRESDEHEEEHDAGCGCGCQEA